MPIVTLPGGEVRDEVRQPLYDTIELLDGQGLVGVYNFFSSVVVASGPYAGTPKTIAKTNMTTPGQLQTAVSFRIQGLCLDAMVAESSAGAWENVSVIPTILNRGGLLLNVGVKTYWQGPARFAAGRMTEYGIGSAATPAVLLQQYGWAAVQPVIFAGRHVVDVNPLQNFLVQLSVNQQDLTTAEKNIVVAPGTDISLVASLKGLMRRPVQ